jgi:Heparinase II/III-like protein
VSDKKKHKIIVEMPEANGSMMNVMDMRRCRQIAVLTIALLLGLPGCASSETHAHKRGRANEYDASDYETPVDHRESEPGEHGGLVISDSEWKRIGELSKQDPIASRWFKSLYDDAVEQLKRPPAYSRVWTVTLSRTYVSRLPLFAAMYRLTGEKRFADAGRRELLAAAALPDWAPDDFLATGEMSAAVGLGYDWLYSVLSPHDRATAREAIITHCLRPADHDYAQRVKWVVGAYNWNLVCNGGVIVAALAIRDESPQFTQHIISEARKSLKNGFSAYAPDGAWEEGPVYWNYATYYATLALAALKSRGVSDEGLSQLPGFEKTGIARLHSIGPSGQTFNFADAERSMPGNSPAFFWMSKRFQQPVLAAVATAIAEARSPTLLDFLWYQPTPALEINLPTSAVTRGLGVEIASMRTGWTDPDASFIAIKAGPNGGQHGHLDLGTFVLDMLGERWAIQFGKDSYDLPGYLSPNGLNYFRRSGRSQNSLMIDGLEQSVSGTSRIVRFDHNSSKPSVTIDLAGAYASQPRQLTRTATLDASGAVTLQDTYRFATPTTMLWRMHTPATVQLKGSEAILTLHDRQIRAQILSPAGATFTNIDDQPPPPEQRIAGVSALRVELNRVRSGDLIVRFSPMASPDQRAPGRPRGFQFAPEPHSPSVIPQDEEPKADRSQ